VASAALGTAEGFIRQASSGRGRRIHLSERDHLQIVDVRGGQAVDFGVLDGLFLCAHVNILVLNLQGSTSLTLRWGFCTFQTSTAGGLRIASSSHSPSGLRSVGGLRAGNWKVAGKNVLEGGQFRQRWRSAGSVWRPFRSEPGVAEGAR
jgi:hypothetical protein